MRNSQIWSRQILYEAKAGAQIHDFFEDVLNEMNNNVHHEAAVLFNGTMVKIKSTDKPAEVYERWNKEREANYCKEHKEIPELSFPED